jgi:hypothetical protein
MGCSGYSDQEHATARAAPAAWSNSGPKRLLCWGGCEHCKNSGVRLKQAKGPESVARRVLPWLRRSSRAATA